MNKEKVIVITGSSTGIGLTTAIQLANKSYTVIASLRNVRKAPEELHTSGCDVQQLDVTDESSANRLVEYIREKYGRCDALINNAGINAAGNIETVSIQDGHRVFDVNVWGVMRMCQKIAPLMRENKGGLLLAISSITAIQPTPYLDVYSASKYAIEGMLEGYRYSVFQHNIKVAVINPGPVPTNMVNQLTEQKMQESPHVDNNMHMVLRDTYVTNLGKGQPVDECAKYICDVTIEFMDKDVSNGELVKFRNGTSEYVKEVAENVYVNPGGSGGYYQPTVEYMKTLLAQHRNDK